MNDSLKDSKRTDPLAKSRTQKNHDLSKKAKELLEKTFSSTFSVDEDKKPVFVPSATPINEKPVDKTPLPLPTTPRSLSSSQAMSESPGGKIDGFLKELFESRSFFFSFNFSFIN